MIDELQQKCRRLSEEVRELRRREHIEVGRRWLTEEVRRLQSNQAQLKDQVRNHADAEDYYRSLAARCFFELDKVLPLLED